MARLLIVDDELSLREFLTIFLRKEGHEVEVASNGQRALEQLQQGHFDLVLTDLRMPRMGGFELLDAIKASDWNTQVIVMTAFSSTETALDAMRRGAYDYIVKPFKLDEVRLIIQKCLEKSQLVAENQQLKKKLAQGSAKKAQFIWKSKAMDDVVQLIRRVANTPSSVLIQGESGTGKELVARMLHDGSDRKNRPFVALNCGAIPEQLMESELFGHVRGSFTGATKDKKGLFEAATSGTIFLDEIGELSLGLQVKLLRVLQERVVTPVGDTREVPVDVRVVAATHRNLRESVQEGRFRADLYFRLNVIEVRMPPLRDRREDILPLARHFLAQFAQRMGRDIKDFDPEAEIVLTTLPYPGNVRELENLVERAVALEPGDRISPTWLPDPGQSSWLAGAGATTVRDEALVKPIEQVQRTIEAVDRWLEKTNSPVDLETLIDRFERGVMEAALRQTAGNKTDAARLLGLTFRSMRYKLAKYGADSAS
ncbi:MAG: sigma-54-dependent Fis family transcriptional regulator [Deltaproteobacteria bacterium]|nr:sigma-54-dependent Fis family transcriptional regulator [Deltaproteobacteria bacterium]